MVNVRHEVDVDKSKNYNATYGSVAQLAEQRTHKPLVSGSNPLAAIYSSVWFSHKTSESKHQNQHLLGCYLNNDEAS